ncbi:hypothetical protein ANN_13815 [Periplaneta americana]|uniref:Uncharacterized protein n=1 Tax=Periplaneta americana TaxID=6978 RepID=A0ABQ8SUK6_PERAM|nr:hypothetical protein ANN_13815 [Periplaneta americana]
MMSLYKFHYILTPSFHCNVLLRPGPVNVTGLMFGARGTIPNFSSQFCKTLRLHKSFLNELALIIREVLNIQILCPQTPVDYISPYCLIEAEKTPIHYCLMECQSTSFILAISKSDIVGL